MKQQTIKNSLGLWVILILWIGMLCPACSDSDSDEAKRTNYGATTQKLIDIVESDSRIKMLLTEAIEQGKRINPDTATNPVQSLEEYYDFVERSQKSMPWEIIFCPGQPTLFGRMYQALCYCYFLNCMPLESLEGENFFTNSIQYLEPYRS